MLKKKSTKIALAIARVLVVVLAVLGVKFFILDAKKVEIPETFEGLTWDLKIEQAVRVLQREGYTFMESRATAFEIKDFGGYEGANGKGAIPNSQDGMLTDIILYFRADEMEGVNFDKFAEACIEELNSKFSKKVSPEKYVEMQKLNQAMNPGLLDYDENMIQAMYFGDVSAIYIMYYKGQKLTIGYQSVDSEYSQEMMALVE